MFKTSFDNKITVKEEYKNKVDKIVELYDKKINNYLNTYEKK